MIIISTVHKINWKQLLISIGIALGIGGLSALVTMNSMDKYETMAKPALSPPGFLFPIVWAILFTLMGISSYLIFNSEDSRKPFALFIYGAQLAVNFFWPIFFFNFSEYLWAFIWILLLWLLIILMIKKFYPINKVAALLQVPYLLWVTFAAYLNFGVYLLN